MARPGFLERVLKLSARRGNGDSHPSGGNFQPLPPRNGYRHFRFAVGQVKDTPQRLDRGSVTDIRIAHEHNAARELGNI